MAHNDTSIQENHHLTTMFVMMAEDNAVHFFEVRKEVKTERQKGKRVGLAGLVLAFTLLFILPLAYHI
jgi:hypothetical protein